MAAVAISRQQSTSFFDRIKSTLSDLTSGLRGTTSLVAPSLSSVRRVENPFGNFGVVASAEKFQTNSKSKTKSSILFSIDEARKRVSEFVENKFKPESITELKDYLAERFLQLETWKLPPGPMNMLVDLRSRAATPAAAVDQRLSYWNMLEQRLRSDLNRAIGNIEPSVAFGSWEGMSMSLANSRGNVGYTVSKSQAYIGKVFADHNDARSIQEIVADARKNGVELILPTEDGTVNGRRVPGLPFLKKMESLKAEVVHSGLKHDVLKAAFGGVGLVETMDKKVQSKQSRENLPGNNVEQVQEFDLSQFLRKEPDPFANLVSDPNASSFGDFAADFDDVNEVQRDLTIREFTSEGEFVVYDRDIDEATQIQFSDMPPGRYERESSDGVVIGYTEILEDGQLKHFDRVGNEVEVNNKVNDQEHDVLDYEDNLPRYGR